MQTIQLSEISCYLSHCLLVKIKGHKHPAPLSGIIYDHTAICDFDTGESDYPMEDITPLVRPLSELTKEDLRAMGYPFDTDLGDNYLLKFMIEATPNKIISVKDFNYLLSRHYDVFGWIERGLAERKGDFAK